jgi:chemotaxis protein histidine kinase CheA
MMNQLSELADEQVGELQSAIISEFESVESEEPSSQTVDAMTSLADMLDAVRGELKQREAAVQELAQRAADAAARVKGEDAEEDMPSEPSEEVEEASPVTETAMVEEKEDEKPMPATEEAKPVTDEAPVASPEAPAEAEEAPASEEEDEEEKKKMSEASTEAKETAELSTEKITEAAVEAAEESVTASVEEATEKSAETELSADNSETPAEEAVELSADESIELSDAEEVAAVEVVAEASVEVPVEAEASSEEVVAEETSNPTELSVEEAQETMEAPVTAAADNAENLDLEVPADRRMETKESFAPVAITAGADIPGYTAGSSLDSMDAVAEAMAKRLHGLRRVNGGDGEQHIVASLTVSFPEERTLSSDAEENWSKIQNIVSPEAITAAGGHVAPFEARYDIFGFGTTARPVRDSLPRFQADRGGIRFVTPPVLSSYGDAVGLWTASNDAAETPNPASKNSLTVSAAAENTVATDAVTLQMQFGNLATRAYPELIARHNELGLIQHAREAEAQILTRLGAESTAVTSTSLIGMGRDVLVQVGRAAAAYRSRHRLEADAPLRVIMPAWVKDAMAADLALSMPGDSTLNAYGEIDGYLAARGINATFTLDGDIFAAQTTGAMTEFKDTFVWYIFAEGTFLFLDGGTLDLGIIRDSTLVGTNDYKMFIETFEGIAKVGVESIQVTSTVQVNGSAAALRDTLGGVASATIEY